MSDTPTTQETMEKVRELEWMESYWDFADKHELWRSIKDEGVDHIENLLTLCEHQAKELQRKDETLDRISTYSSQPRNFEQAMHVIADLTTKATKALNPPPPTNT